MKNRIITIAIGILMGIGGFFTGRHFGIKSTENSYKNRDIEAIRNDLKIKERENVLKFIEATGKVKKKNIGSIFNPEYVNVYEGQISNKASAIQIKDIKLMINFVSKTGTLISSDTIIVYEFLDPHSQINFQERVSVPHNYYTSIARIISAKAQ